MKRFTSLCAIGLLAMTLIPGCGKLTMYILTGEMLEKTRELTAVLHNVTDDSSAKAAAAQVKDLAAKLKSIKLQMNALPTPTPDEEKAIEAKYSADMQTVGANFQGELLRIAINPTLAGPLQDSLTDLQSFK